MSWVGALYWMAERSVYRSVLVVRLNVVGSPFFFHFFKSITAVAKEIEPYP